MSSSLLVIPPSSGYAVLDSGEEEKLERFGEIILSRPDPQALWEKRLSKQEWQKVHAHFSVASGGWQCIHSVKKEWSIELGGLQFWIKLTSFKHTGVFPEQVSNWEWITQIIQKTKRPVSVLNLFGYTGGATLSAARAGASVCHVDASRAAINWAKENAILSGVSDRPIRWILDDARKFLKREVKRGKRYDGIILDPPAFGRGPKGEVWKIEQHLLELLDLCKQVLSSEPIFFLINGYAAGYSPYMYQNNVAHIVGGLGGSTECGELAIQEFKSDRLLPAGIFCRWSRV